MPEQWVVNASPLIVLGRIGQLNLLTKLPQRIVVPVQQSLLKSWLDLKEMPHVLH